MAKAVLYGVSVGPGNPELMTLQAIKTIRKCPVLAAPRTSKGRMVALDIVQRLIDTKGKRIIPLDFAMSRNESLCRASHKAAADLLREALDAGQDVAMLNLGDVSIYASFQYIAQELDSAYPIEMIAGVPSFCAAAARLGMSLTEMDKPLSLVPGSLALNAPLRGEGSRIFMKSGKQLKWLLEQLDREHLLQKTVLVQNCGMEDERIIRDPAKEPFDDAYFSLVIVKE